MKISNKTILKALFTEVKVSKMLYACTILLFMESCFDIVGRKTLSQSPSPSIESSKKIGAYIGSYHWRFISYVDCCVDTLVSIKESFIEKSHHWYSYESDSTVYIDNEYFHIVKLSKKHKNIIFTDFIYGNRMRSRTLVCEYRNTPINTIKDTISTYVIWVPDNHFDGYGVYKFSLNEVPCAKKFNCATTKGNIKLEKGAIVLGKLQFVRDKNVCE